MTVSYQDFAARHHRQAALRLDHPDARGGQPVLVLKSQKGSMFIFHIWPLIFFQLEFEGGSKSSN